MKHTIVGLGEILWDLLPTGKQVGGAPANFAYHCAMLGNEGITVSRIGKDELGQDMLGVLKGLGLPTNTLQIDEVHPTGTVEVELDDAGKPSYTITDDVAWDYLQFTDELKALAGRADAVCFGSLAQRHSVSQQTILNFLEATPPDAFRLFDINLRLDLFNAATIRSSLELANGMKLNDEELPVVMDLLGLGAGEDRAAAKRLMDAFELDVLVLTRGGDGSWLLHGNDFYESPCQPVKIADTVGAGDSFTAAFCHNYLNGVDLALVNEKANRMGGWVASQKGATPAPDDAILDLIR